MHYVAIDPSPVHTAIVSQKWHESRGYLHVDGTTLPILAAVVYVSNSAATLRNMGEEATFIVERPPQTPRGMTIESQQTIAAYWMLVWLIQDTWPETKIVSLAPGSWKPAARGWKIEYPSTLTDQHQRDAYAMLQVHLATKGAKR